MKRKQRLENFVFYDTESVTAHLEGMAQKGWALKDVTNPLWTYEEITPEKRTYLAAFYPANQVYALNAADKQEEYIAYCEPAGWHYVILSILVDTFFSRISLTMLPVPNPHNTSCVLS